MRRGTRPAVISEAESTCAARTTVAMRTTPAGAGANEMALLHLQALLRGFGLLGCDYIGIVSLGIYYQAYGLIIISHCGGVGARGMG